MRTFGSDYAHSEHKRGYRSTAVIVNFEHITLSSSASTVDFQYVFVFWV